MEGLLSASRPWFERLFIFQWRDGEPGPVYSGWGLVGSYIEGYRKKESFWTFQEEALQYLGEPGVAAPLFPAQGALNVPVSANLAWTAGRSAISHRVYFGSTASPPFLGQQSSTTYILPNLQYGAKYYWRVDEVSGTKVTKGTLWSFTVEENPVSISDVVVQVDPALPYFLRTVQGQGAARHAPINGVVSLGAGTAANSDAKWNAQEDYRSIAGLDVFTASGSENAPQATITVDQLKGGQTYAVYGRYVVNTTSSLVYGVQMALAGQTLQLFDRNTPGSTTLRSSAQWQERETFLGNATAAGGAISLLIDDGSIDGATAWSGVRLSLGGACTTPAAATSPNPSNNATGVTTAPTFSWAAASGATSYKIYRGTQATSLVLLGSTTGTSISAGTLSTGITYYWRVDSVNGCGTTTGGTWSFTTSAPIGPNQVEISVTPTIGTFLTTTAGASTSWSPAGSVLASSSNTDGKWWAQADYKSVIGWNVFSAAGAENAPKLSVTVSGLGSGRTYDVYGRYVSNAVSADFYGALMGLSSGFLTTYTNSTAGSQVLASSGNWRVREVLLGQAQAVGGSIVIYVDDNTMTGTAGWYGLRLVGQ